MEMSEEEYDFNMIEKGLYGIGTLKQLRKKYKGKPYMAKKIKEAIDKIENKINLEFYLLKQENEELKERINKVLEMQEQNHKKYINTGLNVWSLTTKQVLKEREILRGS